MGPNFTLTNFRLIYPIFFDIPMFNIFKTSSNSDLVTTRAHETSTLMEFKSQVPLYDIPNYMTFQNLFVPKYISFYNIKETLMLIFFIMSFTIYYFIFFKYFNLCFPYN